MHKWIMFQLFMCTGWRRLIGSPQLQIIFHKRAIKYRSLLLKMTYKDKGSYESSPPCTDKTYCRTFLNSNNFLYKLVFQESEYVADVYEYKRVNFMCINKSSWRNLWSLTTRESTLQPTSTHCNTLQRTATRCNTLHHTAPHCTTLHHTATHCIALQHTATHCNALQHTAMHCNRYSRALTTRESNPIVFEEGTLPHRVNRSFQSVLQCISVCWNVLQCENSVLAHRINRLCRNVLQRVVVRCSALQRGGVCCSVV